MKKKFSVREIQGEIRRMKEDGMDIHEIAEALNKAGYTTKTGKKFESHTVVYYTPKNLKRKVTHRNGIPVKKSNGRGYRSDRAMQMLKGNVQYAPDDSAEAQKKETAIHILKTPHLSLTECLEIILKGI